MTDSVDTLETSCDSNSRHSGGKRPSKGVNERADMSMSVLSWALQSTWMRWEIMAIRQREIYAWLLYMFPYMWPTDDMLSSIHKHIIAPLRLRELVVHVCIRRATPDAMFICSVGNIDVCTIDHIRSWLKSQVHNCFPNPQSTWSVGIWSSFLSTMHHLSRFDTSATLEWSVLGSTIYSSNWRPSCIETPQSSYTLQGRLLNRW